MVPRAIDLAESDEMNRIAPLVFRPALPVLFLFTSLLGTTSIAQEPAPSPGKMTIWQARRAMTTALGTGIRFSPDSIEYDIVNYKTKVPTTVKIDIAMARPWRHIAKAPSLTPVKTGMF